MDKTELASGAELKPKFFLIERGLSLFLGVFTLLNILGRLLNQDFDANQWWIDLKGLPAGVDGCLLGLVGLVLVSWALLPVMKGWRRHFSRLAMLLLAAILLVNSFRYYILLFSGHFYSKFPVPFTLFLTLITFLIWRAMRANPQTPGPCRTIIMMGGAIIASLIIFPIFQVICFGCTDYRRPADAIVVFGARAYANGEPSLALADRVRTGCELYGQGLAPRIIFSGGPGDGEIHETTVMREMALKLGVPETAIILDDEGLNSRATIANLENFLESPAPQVLAVSHFFHLPRIKLLAQQSGLDIYTVPARQSRMLGGTPFFILREVGGLWHHYGMGFLKKNSQSISR